eukprot:4480152-Prymnesium_polylepis.1
MLIAANGVADFFGTSPFGSAYLHCSRDTSGQRTTCGISSGTLVLCGEGSCGENRPRTAATLANTQRFRGLREYRAVTQELPTP